jgi:putative copper export protein
VFYLSFLLIPVLAYFYVKKLRNALLKGSITFSTAWNFGILLFFFGGLIIAFVVYVCGQYVIPETVSQIIQFQMNMVDYSINRFTENNASPQQIELMRHQWRQLADIQHNTATIELAVGLLWNCVVTGFFLSVPIALIVKKKLNKPENTSEIT